LDRSVCKLCVDVRLLRAGRKIDARAFAACMLVKGKMGERGRGETDLGRSLSLAMG
jgi:hypothetical protein